MTRRYFGTDGIRGQSNQFPMTPDLAMRVGIAVGTIFRRGHHRHRVVIGKDTRLSGYMLENALVAGFTAAGLDVFLLGPIPTPAVAMLTRSLRADIGVMISASHNPFADNGIKLFDRTATSFRTRSSTRSRPCWKTTSTRSWHPPMRSAGPSASRATSTAISNSSSARCRATSPCMASGSPSTAPTVLPTRWRRPLSGSSVPRW